MATSAQTAEMRRGETIPASMAVPGMQAIGVSTKGMSGVRKAAILIVALGDELAKALLQSMQEEDVQRVCEEIAALDVVPPAILAQVLNEFYGMMETQQRVVRGGSAYAKRMLTEAFGRTRAEEMMTQVKRAQFASNGDLAMLRKMDPQQLGKFLENEHPQTVALVLAHLDAERGSTLLMHLNSEQRVDVVHRLAEMRQFSPEMAHKVARVLYRRMESLGSTGRQSYAGFKAVADMLNRLEQPASKGILESIEAKAPQLAIGIRELMFTFEDLLTVPEQSIREIVSAADKKMLGLALKGAKEDIRAHLFKAMSSRAVEMLQEDMEALGPVRGRDVQLAQQQLLAVARQLEEEGKIVLKMEAEHDFPI